MKSDHHNNGYPSGGGTFNTTHWSAVLMAKRQEDPTRSFHALSQLCQTYWYPLYAYVRRRGYGVDDALDLTQEFFARLIDKKYLESVNRDRGKFRSFLLAAMSHFLANEWRKATTQKRGGGCSLVCLNDDSAEDRYRNEPVTDLSADTLFERRWAMTLLDNTMMRLRRECIEGGKGLLFDQLKSFLAGDRTENGYAGAAAALGVTVGAVKVSVHRLRKRYGEILRDEIAQTVSSEQEVEQEIGYLFHVLEK